MIDYSVFDAHRAGSGKFVFARVLPGGDAWFGVTYREYRRRVVATIRHLIESGHYLKRLWA